MEINQYIVPYNDQPEADYADKLYPGYKFIPSDSDLIVHYLKPKIATGTHPPCRLHEVYLYDHHPQQLSETYRASENKWYFLTSRERKYPKGSRPKRSTKEFGTWKATQKHTTVYDEANRQMVVGYKTNLAFFDEKGRKTAWLMHEYTTDDPNLPFGSGQNGNELNRYVLCKVYKKETSRNRDRDQAEEIRNVRTRGEVERGSPLLSSAPVNHGSILEQGTMNTTHHPIMQPFVTNSHGSSSTLHGSSSIQSASEDPHQGFRREVETYFVAAPPLPDGYINNYTMVASSPSPVYISRDGSEAELQNVNQDFAKLVDVQSGGSYDEQSVATTQDAIDHVPGVPPDFAKSASFPLDLSDGFTLDDVEWNSESYPVSISRDGGQAEFQNLDQDFAELVDVQSGSNDQQSVAKTHDAIDQVPEPADFAKSASFPLDLLDRITLDDMELNFD